jgi:NAD(P)-dependent dehydrogenase (short-subunit alcohol dehydrogenase family)
MNGLRLNGRTAMVTGAAYRGGKELVRTLAAEGARVAVCATALLKSRAHLADQPGRIVAYRMNMRDPVSVRVTLDKIHESLAGSTP